MRIYVQNRFDIYGIVYMLAPKDDTVHVRLIWLPDHLASEANGTCHYELKFEAVDCSDSEKERWLEGLPELLINWDAKRNNGIEIPARENVIKIEHDNAWEVNLLVEIAGDPMWSDDYADFGILSKLGWSSAMMAK